MRVLVTYFACIAGVLFALSTTAYAKDPQLVPLRLSSTGDSMTLGGDAEHYGPNVNASWVNGYYDFWQWMQGLTNVYSHNQRISAIWGTAGRTNFVNAVGGAAMNDFPAQAMRAVKQQAQYVTVLMGHNDVCQAAPWMIPTDESFEANFRIGLDILRDGLPAGATVYVLATANLRHLWDVAQYKQLRGLVDCPAIWSLERFPCHTMLDPANAEADREYAQSRNITFNNILQSVTAEYDAADSHHYYYFSDALFVYPFIERDVSNLDCFHPSARGQKTISWITWSEGPFKAYQAAK